MKLGLDPVHFGIMIVVNIEVGRCHPPVGLNLYVASGITKMGITELAIAVRQWLLTMLVFLVVVTYWPALSIWVPKTFGMMWSVGRPDPAGAIDPTVEDWDEDADTARASPGNAARRAQLDATLRDIARDRRIGLQLRESALRL